MASINAAKGKVSDELFEQANAIYQAMITDVRKLLSITNVNFGKTVVAPSQLVETLAEIYAAKELQLNKTYGPVYEEETQKILALSVNDNDEPIIVAVFNEKIDDLKQAFKRDFETLQTLIKHTNNAIIKLATDWSAKPGNATITAGDIYTEINRRAIEKGAHVCLEVADEKQDAESRTKFSRT